MASMGGATANSKASAKPPEKGSFPLDHFHECKSFMEKYMACLKREANAHAACREETKAYLQCRMNNGLMVAEDMSKFGLNDKVDFESSLKAQQAHDEARRIKYQEGFVSGLARGKGRGQS